MAVFLIAEVKLIDDAWVPNYASRVHDIVHKHGGKYLSRSANVTPIEGEKPDATVIGILQFPSLAAAQSFANDPDYAPHAAARKSGSISKLYVIDDTDVAGTVPYLAKG
jgi:uncharacterized protein (DUF1330 family)